MPPISGLIEQRDQLLDKLSQQGNLYVTTPPTPLVAFGLFEGEWSSNVPGFGMGSIGLFNDPRMWWLGKQVGGFAGKRILELGPLEGGHTYMMSRAGAARITSIESNMRAFHKCLIVKNALGFDADFMLGDFRHYLANTNDTYDFVLASGVLYHMLDPVKLLVDIARIAPSIGVWTHYYDDDVIRSRPELKKRFADEPTAKQFQGRALVSYEQMYLEAESLPGFCGGNSPNSYWMTKNSLLDVLDALGLKVTVGEDTKDHPNGPSLLFYATR
jgi:hypothetical protein